ncbi:MAG: Rha family transcriptional regulator [Candidatus Competibacter denitrificans]
MATQLIPLTLLEGEPRVDSRIVAYELGVTHRNTYELVDNYSAEFQEFGHLRFQTEVGDRRQGGGNPIKFYLLNEDQTYFLMTLVRNTPEAVELKKRLVKAFAQFRTVANPLEIAPKPSIEIETLRAQLAACHTELLRIKPLLGQLRRYHQMGLNQREIARLFGWASRESVRLHTRHAERLGLIAPPETRQLTLLEG